MNVYTLKLSKEQIDTVLECLELAAMDDEGDNLPREADELWTLMGEIQAQMTPLTLGQN